MHSSRRPSTPGSPRSPLPSPPGGGRENRTRRCQLGRPSSTPAPFLPSLCARGGAPTAFSPDAADDVGKTSGLEVGPAQTSEPHTGTLAAVPARGSPVPSRRWAGGNGAGPRGSEHGRGPPAEHRKSMSLNYVGARPAHEDPWAAVLGGCRPPSPAPRRKFQPLITWLALPVTNPHPLVLSKSPH